MSSGQRQNIRLGARLALTGTRRALAGSSAVRMLVIALVVAVAAVTAVTRLTDRVDAAISAQAAQTLGADLALKLAAKPSAGQQKRLNAKPLTTARNTRLDTALAVGDNLLRVSVSAVSPNYPLAGTLKLRRNGRLISVDHGPPPGRIWIDDSIATRLDIAPGDKINVGNAKLTVGAVLVSAPGGGASLFETAPHLIMAGADLAATGLTGPGARVKYTVLIDGPPAALSDLRKHIAPTLRPGERLVDPAQANRGLAAAMNKAAIFLNLAALAAVVLAGIAIALSAARHAESQRDAVALYKTLGAARGVIRAMLAVQLAALGLIGWLAGSLIGELTAFGLARLVDSLFAVALPAGHLWASWPSAGVAAALLAGFAWPMLRAALATPPARVLARSADSLRRRRWPAYGLAILAVAGMAVAATGSFTLTVWVVAALAGAALIFALVAWGLLIGLGILRRRLDTRLALSLRLGLDGVLRRRATVGLQCVALGLGLAVIFVLVIVRGDLLAGWQASVADNAPNRFVINVNGDQRADIKKRLARAGVASANFYPIVRARLTAVDGQKLSGDAALQDKAGRLAKRALNLSWAHRLKADNRIVAGHWWRNTKAGARQNPVPLSIARSVARRLELGVGARLSFDVAGQSFTGRVTSVRHIDWSSLQPNFLILLPPGALACFPTRWITSFYLPPGHEAAMAGLVRAHPNLNVINVAALLKRVQTLVDRVSLAVELVFSFTLAAGLVVLAAAMGAQRAARRREVAVLRALGATSRLLRRGAWTECGLIGVMAAVPAALAAQVAARLIATDLLHVEYTLRPGVWLLALVSAIALVTTAGVLILGNIRRQPAWAALRAGR